MRGYCHVTSSYMNLIRLSPKSTVPYRYPICTRWSSAAYHIQKISVLVCANITSPTVLHTRMYQKQYCILQISYIQEWPSLWMMATPHLDRSHQNFFTPPGSSVETRNNQPNSSQDEVSDRNCQSIPLPRTYPHQTSWPPALKRLHDYFDIVWLEKHRQKLGLGKFPDSLQMFAGIFWKT